MNRELLKNIANDPEQPTSLRKSAQHLLENYYDEEE
jgi:hypothetical protein